MVIFEVNFIFCCPAVPVSAYFVHRRHPKKHFDVDNFERKKSLFVLCFDHLAEAMYLNTVDCLYYYKSVFYRVVLNNCQYPKKVVLPVIEEV